MRHGFVFSLAVFLAFASAVRADVTMTIGNVTADTGSLNGYIPVTVAGSTFAGFGLTLMYDNSVFELVPGWLNPQDRIVSETMALTRLSRGYVVKTERRARGKTTTLSITGFRDPGVANATGLFLKLVVNVTGEPGSETPVTCTAYTFTDKDGKPLRGYVTNGRVAINRLASIGRGPDLIQLAFRQGAFMPQQTFDVWNRGGKTLNYRITTNVPWLTCAPNSGRITGGRTTVGVRIASGQLLPGRYTANIIIADPNADNSPQAITVEIMVYARVRPRPR